MISILKCTQKEYAEAIHKLCGKGRLQANHVYEEFYRRGKKIGEECEHPLVSAIVRLTDFSMPDLVTTRHDGMTGKFLVRINEKYEVESVMIPMKAGGTLCVSSQVGCRMGCAFCETGRMGLLQNLRAEEIVAQVYIAKFHFGFDVRNVVFMGMGEPFDNYEEVICAAKVLQCPFGFGFGRTHITISTSGCVDGILRLIDEVDGPNLAVSVNAPNDVIRRKIMPVTRKHSMAELYEAMRQYCTKTKRQILIAYVLMQDVNDRLEHADELADYLQGLDVKVNLIPYNPQSNDRYRPPSDDLVECFMHRLREKGYYTLLRKTKGDKIMAACGQLGNIDLRKKLQV